MTEGAYVVTRRASVPRPRAWWKPWGPRVERRELRRPWAVVKTATQLPVAFFATEPEATEAARSLADLEGRLTDRGARDARAFIDAELAHARSREAE